MGLLCWCIFHQQFFSFKEFFLIYFLNLFSLQLIENSQTWSFPECSSFLWSKFKVGVDSAPILMIFGMTFRTGHFFTIHDISEVSLAHWNIANEVQCLDWGCFQVVFKVFLSWKIVFVMKSWYSSQNSNCKTSLLFLLPVLCIPITLFQATKYWTTMVFKLKRIMNILLTEACLCRHCRSE